MQQPQLQVLHKLQPISTANTTARACSFNVATTNAAALNDAGTANATTAKATPNYPHNRLAFHVEKVIAAFKASTSWANCVSSGRGRGDLHPGVNELPHSAAHLLSRFHQSRTPAMMKTAPWPAERRVEALKRNPHQSSHRGIEFL